MDGWVCKIGNELCKAYDDQKPVLPFSSNEAKVDEKTAYVIQKIVVQHLLEKGWHLSGKKLGYTNPEMQKKMKLTGPSYGWLFREKRYLSGARIPYKDFIQPGIESEILFRVNEDLKGRNFKRDEILHAVDSFSIAIEIVDMRQIRQGKTQIDSIGDNGSFGAYVVGRDTFSIEHTKLGQLAACVKKNGEVIAEGKGSAVMGDPVNALCWLANRTANTEDYLRCGDEILSGSFTSLIPVKIGEYLEVAFDTLGSVCVEFV